MANDPETPANNGRLLEYQQSKTASQNYAFFTLLMAAMRNADTGNLAKLTSVFPEVYEELQARYNGPGGRIPGDKDYEIFAIHRHE